MTPTPDDPATDIAREVGPLLEQAGIMDRIAFEGTLTDKQLLLEMGVPAASFEVRVLA